MPKKKKQPKEIIRIAAGIQGFRRAGMAHYGTEEYPLSKFTAEQIAALKEEKLLTVEIFTEAEEDSGAEDDAGQQETESVPAAEPVGNISTEPQARETAAEA